MYVPRIRVYVTFSLRDDVALSTALAYIYACARRREFQVERDRGTPVIAWRRAREGTIAHQNIRRPTWRQIFTAQTGHRIFAAQPIQSEYSPPSPGNQTIHTTPKKLLHCLPI
jgi:hypothetical protein